MTDYIDRQAAIDELHMNLMYRMGTDSNKQRLDEWINNLPSAEPEPKEGKWIVHLYKLGRERYECSECTGRCDLEYNFCPNCGADMR